MGAGTENGHFGLSHGHNIMMEVGVSICGPKANNWRKCLILLTVIFIGEEILSLFTLLNTGLSRQLCSEILLKTGENIFHW